MECSVVKCDLCSSPLTKTESIINSSPTPSSCLTAEVIAKVCQSLLIPPQISRKVLVPELLLTCQDCLKAWNNLSSLFDTLQYLRSQFNDLRRSIGVNLIPSIVILSDQDKETKASSLPWESLSSWEEGIKAVDHIFPSCLKVGNQSGEDVESGGPKQVKVTQNNGQSDPKLKVTITPYT